MFYLVLLSRPHCSLWVSRDDSFWPKEVEGFCINLLYFVSNSDSSTNQFSFDLLMIMRLELIHQVFFLIDYVLETCQSMEFSCGAAG